MIAADIPTALLAVGIAALCVTTAISTLALPQRSPSWRRRRSRHQLGLPAAPVRRVITGRPAMLPPGPLPARQELPPRDSRSRERTQSQARRLDAVESLVDDVLARDPERLADVMSAWINEDPMPTASKWAVGSDIDDGRWGRQR